MDIYSLIYSILMYHSHYWGIPHERRSDRLLIQICYECGKERVIKVDLRPLQVPTDAMSLPRDTEAA
jgi:hypothetical protein